MYAPCIYALHIRRKQCFCMRRFCNAKTNIFIIAFWGKCSFTLCFNGFRINIGIFNACRRSFAKIQFPFYVRAARTSPTRHLRCVSFISGKATWSIVVNDSVKFAPQWNGTAWNILNSLRLMLEL